MLEDIWEGEQTSLSADDASKCLRDIALVPAADIVAESIDSLEELMAILLVAEIFEVIVATLAER